MKIRSYLDLFPLEGFDGHAFLSLTEDASISAWFSFSSAHNLIIGGFLLFFVIKN